MDQVVIPHVRHIVAAVVKEIVILLVQVIVIADVLLVRADVLMLVLDVLVVVKIPVLELVSKHAKMVVQLAVLQTVLPIVLHHVVITVQELPHNGTKQISIFSCS